jgi:hypothetical protein
VSDAPVVADAQVSIPSQVGTLFGLPFQTWA